MKTAISISQPLFEEAALMARQLGLSRSQLYTHAIEEFVSGHRDANVTKALNNVYSKTPSTIDPLLNHMQLLSLPPED